MGVLCGNTIVNDKQVNARICLDWLEAFPSLSKFSINKFYAIQGCFIHGIELVKDRFSDSYMPYYVIYPLWLSNVEECFSKPYVLLQIKNDRNLQISILKARHDTVFPSVAAATSESLPFLKVGKINLPDLRNLLFQYLSNPMIKSNTGGQADVWELLLKIYLFEGLALEVGWILDEIRKKEQEWNSDVFNYWHGSFKTWFAGIVDCTENPANFFAKVTENLTQKKIRQLCGPRIIVG